MIGGFHRMIQELWPLFHLVERLVRFDISVNATPPSKKQVFWCLHLTGGRQDGDKQSKILLEIRSTMMYQALFLHSSLSRIETFLPQQQLPASWKPPWLLSFRLVQFTRDILSGQNVANRTDLNVSRKSNKKPGFIYILLIQNSTCFNSRKCLWCTYTGYVAIYHKDLCTVRTTLCIVK